MEISINKLKQVIDDLQDVQLEYKKQLITFEQVYKEYKSIDSEQQMKQAFKKVYEDLDEEYRLMKQIQMTLTDIVNCYSDTEKTIVGSMAGVTKSKFFLKTINIEKTREILDRFNIKFS